jgi:four helix bundle protein
MQANMWERGIMTGSFKDLIVWQRAVELSLAICKLTAAFPAPEQFGLTNQLRRASVSIASNIAEGYGRSTKGEYVQSLGYARGSNCEVQTQLVIAGKLGFGAELKRLGAENLCDEIGRMLVVLMRKLRA